MQKYHSLHTKKTLLTFLFFVSSLTALLLFIPKEKEASIYENTFRVHIIAASDQSQDQAIKYTLRDELMPTVTDLVKHCQTSKETEAVLLAHQEEILVQAQDILKNQGYIKGVLVEIGEFRYDKRVLNGKIYPGGVYPSLRLVIGEGAGQNWWSVLYPSVALYVSSDAKAEDFSLFSLSTYPKDVAYSFRLTEWLSSQFQK